MRDLRGSESVVEVGVDDDEGGDIGESLGNQPINDDDD